jgi:hypothetical protein
VSNHLPNNQDARSELVELVTRAEASVESMEAADAGGRWAMTAFSRYRLCELLDILPYRPYDDELVDDPAGLLEEAARIADRLEVPIEDLSWRLALGDALRTAAADIRMVQGARDL